MEVEQQQQVAEGEVGSSPAQQFEMAWAEGRKVIEQKLYAIGRTREELLRLNSEKGAIEAFTLAGGLFALPSLQAETSIEEKPGSYNWVVRRRLFIESLLEQLSQQEQPGEDLPELPSFVKNPVDLEEVLLRLEAFELQSDDELANQILIALTNLILSSDADSASLYKRLIGLTKDKLLNTV